MRRPPDEMILLEKDWTAQRAHLCHCDTRLDIFDSVVEFGLYKINEMYFFAFLFSKCDGVECGKEAQSAMFPWQSPTTI